MRVGIVEKILERRIVVAASALAEHYQGVDLADSPEARTLPVPIYACAGCGYARSGVTVDRMYCVDEQAMLSAGWYCQECVDKLEGKPSQERLYMEIFLIMLDSDLKTG